MVETKLKISGLDCVECARGLEQSIANLPRVESANLQFMDGTLTVNGAVNQKDLRKMVKRFGYRVEEGTLDEAAPADSANALLGFWDYLMQRVETRLALIAGAMVVLSLGFGILRFPNWVVISLQMSALVLAGWPIARSGIVNLWVNHTFNINFLMTLAGIGAVVIGEYAEAASLILLFNIAEALEGYSTARARGELAQLTDLAATHAVRLDGSEELVVPVESLSVGDRILVRPGDRIPIDGKILEGQSDINQAPITGESIPVWKDAGDQVFSGSINGTGRLILAVTRLVADSTLQRIIDLVTKAQSRQSRSQKFIDRFARYYTPAMVLLALLIAVIPPLFFGGPFFNTADGTRGWLHRALVMLVISCPCALVISTPVTMAASLARAARKGVLFKGGIFIESLSKMSVFAFDKTGTLTKGEPSVQACRDLSCRKDGGCEACDDMIALAYALERHSAHPLAQAIKAEAEWRGVMDRYPAAKNLVTRQGLGLEGRIKGRTMTIGSLRLFEAEHEIPPVVHDWVDQAEGKGRTAMLLCDGEKVRGFIAVADTPREVSREVIHALNEMGKHTVMLTGDNDTVAAAIGEMIGLDDRRAGLMPGDKQAAIRELQDQFGSVAMVGDGINDAPALASANLGIAMGGSGSAQAMETADVVLMADNLRQLPFALKLSAFANRLIRQNILFSLGSKLLVAGIALFGYTPLWLAVLADMGVSLLVTLNGLRALRFRD